MNTTAFVAIAGGLVMATSGTTTVHSDDFERTIPVAPGGTFHAELDIGEVDIETHGEDTIRIETRAGSWPWTVEFEVEQTGGDVRLVSSASTDDGVLAQGARWALWPFQIVTVDVRVWVPRDFSVSAATDGGDIDVSDVGGNARVRTGGGRILLENVVGNVDASTAGGRIYIEEVQGDVRAESGGGRIYVEVVQGGVDVRSGGGRIYVEDAAGEVVAVTGGGRIFTSFTGTPTGNIETGGGRIEVRFPEGAGVDLTATTGGGRVRLDEELHFSGVRTEREWRGTINGGGSPLRVHTSGGRIKIKAL